MDRAKMMMSHDEMEQDPAENIHSEEAILILASFSCP